MNFKNHAKKMFFDRSLYNYLLPIPLLLIGVYYPIRKLMSFLAFHPPATQLSDFSNFKTLKTSTSQIPYYFLKSRNNSKKTILLSHGNGTNIIQMVGSCLFNNRIILLIIVMNIEIEILCRVFE